MRGKLSSVWEILILSFLWESSGVLFRKLLGRYKSGGQCETGCINMCWGPVMRVDEVTRRCM